MLPLPLAFGLILLLRRSFQPLREFARGIWNDWTLLSLAMYSFFGYVMLIYDENHHPFLLAFMVASTIVICGAVWLYMSNKSMAGRIFSLAAGFAAAWLIGWVCDNTWDAAGYYNLPAGGVEAWYVNLIRSSAILGLWVVTLFWPAVIALVHRPVKPPASPQF